MGSRTCPNRTKLGIENPMCTQSVKQKEFLLQLAQEKSSYFNRKYRLIRLFYFQKYRNFIGSRSCPNVTKLGVDYPMCIQSLKQKEFLLQLVQEKSPYFNRKYLTYSLILFSKIQKFYWIKELSKCNQTRYGLSHVYLKSKTKRIFAIACLGKKLDFHTGICEFRDQRISKTGLFRRVKELSKSHQTWHGVSHVYLEWKTKKNLLQLAQEKSQIFIREFANFAIREFQKQVYFVWSRSCPNRTKLGMEYPMCIQSVKQKEFLL